MRLVVVLAFAVLASACSHDSGDPSGDDAAADVDAAVPGFTTTCDFAAPAVPGDTCMISDWEHDFTCTFIGPEEIWLCCRDVTATGGGECQYASCPTELGAPCCDGGPATGSYVCVDGRWADPS
jgi:hypothetical protein